MTARLRWLDDVIGWIIALYFRIRNRIKFGKIDTSEYDKMIDDLVQEVTGVPDYLLPPPPCGKGGDAK